MSLYIYIILVIIITGILLFANFLISPSKPDIEKVSPFECGLSPLLGQTRSPFSISYYLIALLFLLFDLEVLLLYPIAVSLHTIGLQGFWIAVTFFSLLTLGFVVELAYGVLSFTDHRSAIRNPTITT